jgi:hypothetical protein
VRVRAVRDDDVGRVDDAGREVAVKIVADRDHRPLAEDGSHSTKDVRLRGLVEAHDLHRAVEREVDAVDRTGVLEPPQEIVDDAFERFAEDGPARDRERRHQRHGRHVARETRGLHEASQLGVREVTHELGTPERRRLCQRVARQVVHAVEVLAGRHEGRERVRLVEDAAVRDAERTARSPQAWQTKAAHHAAILVRLTRRARP